MSEQNQQIIFVQLALSKIIVQKFLQTVKTVIDLLSLNLISKTYFHCFDIFVFKMVVVYGVNRTELFVHPVETNII